MGVVYKAQDLKLDRLVALKFLPPHLAADGQDKKRFIHEAKAASSLNHPNICDIHEIDETPDGHLFIVMALYQGTPLNKKIDEGPLKIDEALDIAIQTAEGLQAAHEKGITHRDVKSSNIMVSDKGRAVVMDFGLARTTGATKLTRTGATLGTLPYMSPEQAQGEKVDYRTDIWSLGVVLYEMITGGLPFKSEYKEAVVYSILNENPPPITSRRSDVPMELERIASKALAKDKTDRYQHADEIIVDLRMERKRLESTRVGHVHTSTTAPTVEAAPLKKRPWNYLVPAAVVLATVILMLIFNPFNFHVSMQRSTAMGKNSLAVMYFENMPDPEDKDRTADMLTNLLITALSQTRELDIISRERLIDIQTDLGQTDVRSISSSTATQVAKRAGVRTMLLGTILQKEPALVVTTRLIDVESGNIVGSQRLPHFTSTQIFGLIDSLAQMIRGDFNIAQTSAGETKPVAEVTTRSLEAYRSYVEGLDLADKYYRREASAAFRRAIELDKEFAMAYFRLFGVQSRLGESEAARYSLQKAVEFSDKASERERLQILAASFNRQNDPQKAAATLEKLLERYPRDKAYLDLAATYRTLLQREKSVQVNRRGLKVDPYDKILWNVLAYDLAALNRRDEALAAISEYLKLAPAEPNPYNSKGHIHAKFGEYDSARIWYQKANAFRHGYSAQILGFDALIRGRYNEAEQYLQMSGFQFPVIEISRGMFKAAQQKLADTPSAPISQGGTFAALRQHMQVAYEASAYPEMLRLAKQLTVEFRKNPQDKIYGRDYLAWAWAKNGNALQAHKILSEMQADIDPKLPILQVTFDYASALVAFEEEKYDEAIEQFRKVYSTLPPNHDPNLFFAVGLLKKGEIGDATSQLERLTRWYPTIGGAPTLLGSPGSALYWPISSVKAHYWLGVAYEQQGEKQKAIKEYETFLDIWNDADTITKEMQDAKKRVVKLKAVAKN